MQRQQRHFLADLQLNKNVLQILLDFCLKKYIYFLFPIMHYFNVFIHVKTTTKKALSFAEHHIYLYKNAKKKKKNMVLLHFFFWSFCPILPANTKEHKEMSKAHRDII